eukprot:6214820-Pleurochrysis_carterae.AAC.3
MVSHVDALSRQNPIPCQEPLHVRSPLVVRCVWCQHGDKVEIARESARFSTWVLCDAHRPLGAKPEHRAGCFEHGDGVHRDRPRPQLVAVVDCENARARCTPRQLKQRKRHALVEQPAALPRETDLLLTSLLFCAHREFGKVHGRRHLPCRLRAAAWRMDAEAEFPKRFGNEAEALEMTLHNETERRRLARACMQDCRNQSLEIVWRGKQYRVEYQRGSTVKAGWRVWEQVCCVALFGFAQEAPGAQGEGWRSACGYRYLWTLFGAGEPAS